MRRVCAAALILSAMITALWGGWETARGSDTENHIRQVEHGLLPPVIVKGEPPAVSDLATRMAQLHVPGVSVAVIHDGKIAWARGFGVTRPGGPPVTPDTLFQAASLSKPVTALAVMKLWERRRVDLDTNVNQYLKSWRLPDNELTQARPVTLRELLTHTAGVTVPGFPGYEAGSPLPTVTQILDGQAPANNSPIRVDIQPEKIWRYSGGGYVIAGQVLTDVTGIAFPRLMHDLLLRPLGMAHSTYEQPLPPNLLAKVAVPYQSDGTEVKGGPHVYPELPAAGLWTTPSDIARYVLGVQAALAGKRGAVISAKTAQVMLTSTHGEQGLGPIVIGSAERPLFNHGGSSYGYRCFFAAYERGDGVVVMTNSDNGEDLWRQMVRTIAYEYGWPDYSPAVRTITAVDPTSFDPHAGAYRFSSGDVVTFWREGDTFMSRIWGQPTVEIYPTSEHEYFAKVVDALWTFYSDNGAGSTATLRQNSFDRIAKKLDGPEGQAALDISISAERRFKDQTPAPGGEAALRRLIVEITNSTPNYDEMSSTFAQIVRQKLPELQKALAQLGALQSLSFRGVGPAGGDIYDVAFEHGSRQFRILLEADDRIHAAELSLLR
jgi:CubicO group peptidase (beta-lactamase class C family)